MAWLFKSGAPTYSGQWKAYLMEGKRVGLGEGKGIWRSLPEKRMTENGRHASE
ncbi:hypothetical protein AGMMS50296_5770 [Alphaproteobacteria bacterium]|nr:hypothetical protein AGMMS50296_5770 [Alphaproteobacteria bacterium]